jgi:UDP-N-acetylmuramoyl-L-alanyl-D-glutamate--2,6-diaminopimelate ligase
LQASDIRCTSAGLSFTISEASESYKLSSQILGNYNVSNLLGVMGGLRALGIPLKQAVQACQGLPAVPGRLEIVNPEKKSDQPMAVLDYAHTPDALAKVLQTLQPIAQERGGKLWCVFGCGGDRDPLKRPLMGAIAAQSADEVVLTSDNPRSEKAQNIISQILMGLEGMKPVKVQPDRALAIAQTLQQAHANDVVLVAGKGHENYQEIAGERLPFSDREHLQRGLRTWRKGQSGMSA